VQESGGCLFKEHTQRSDRIHTYRLEGRVTVVQGSACTVKTLTPPGHVVKLSLFLLAMMYRLMSP